MTQPVQPYGVPQPFPPYGLPPPAPRPTRVSPPATGWALLLLGAVTVIGSVTPWATVHVGDVSRAIVGTRGDGTFTLFFGLVVAAMGLLVVTRQGRLWTSVVALVVGAISTLTAVVDHGSLTGHVGPDSALLPTSAYSVGFGLWLVLISGVLAVVAAIVAVSLRQ